MTIRTYTVYFDIDTDAAEAAGSDEPTVDVLADYVSLVCDGFGRFRNVEVIETTHKDETP